MSILRCKGSEFQNQNSRVLVKEMLENNKVSEAKRIERKPCTGSKYKKLDSTYGIQNIVVQLCLPKKVNSLADIHSRIMVLVSQLEAMGIESLLFRQQRY